MEAMGIEPTNLLHAMQALYQLSYAPQWRRTTLAVGATAPDPPRAAVPTPRILSFVPGVFG